MKNHTTSKNSNSKKGTLKKRTDGGNRSFFSGIQKNKKNGFSEEKRKEKTEFMNIVNEIRNIALPHLTKFQRKIVENDKIKNLGGRFDKSRKVHYPELMCRKKTMKKYIEKRKEKEKIFGVQFQTGNYTDMQDVFRKKKKENKKKKSKKNKLF